MALLLSIPREVLQEILSQLCNLSVVNFIWDKSQLFPLSRTSRRLRHECLPFLFYEYRHTLKAPGQFLPAKFWQFIQVLHIFDPQVKLSDFENQALAAEELYRILPNLSAVTCCRLTTPGNPDPDLIKALTTLPSLSSFELLNTYFISSHDPKLHDIKSLSRLIIQRESFGSSLVTKENHIAGETYQLLVLASLSNLTLEHLEIPAESSRFKLMAQWSWPRLRTLSIKGETIDTTLYSFLRKAPKLIHLDYQVGNPKEKASYIISPQDVANELDAFDTQMNMPKLRSLTILYPMYNDGLFHHTQELTHLSLLASLTMPLGFSLWSFDQVIRKVTHDNFPSLINLRFIIQGAYNEKFYHLLGHLSDELPALEVFEVQCYPPLCGNPQTISFNLDLSGRFLNLRQLGLGCRFHILPDLVDLSIRTASCLPSLKFTTFTYISRNAVVQSWYRVVRGTAIGVEKLEF